MKKMLMEEERNKIINCLKIVLLVLIFILTTFLFYRQAVEYNGAYRSDLPVHIKFAVKGKGYSILYVAIGFLMNITNNVISVAVLQSLLVIGSIVITNKIIMEYVPVEKKNLSFFVSYALTFLGSIYIPVLYEKFYMSTLVTQPWHNITYLGMRFFALFTMYEFGHLYDSYLKEVKLKQWFLVAVSLLLATAIKPNFLIAFAFSLLTMLIIDFFKNFGNWNAFFNIIKMGTVVFPACFVLLLQSFILYAPKDSGESSSGIAIIWFASWLKAGVYKNILKIITGLSFPIFVFICNRETFKKQEKFAYLMFFITYIEVYMLAETGKRASHGNFYWGLFCSAYILFIYAVGVFLRNFSMKEKKEIVQNTIACLLLALHLLSGFVYFIRILEGQMFAM